MQPKPVISYTIELNPGDPNTYNNKRNIFLQMKKYNLALDCFEKAIELDPRNSYFYYNIACYYSRLNLIDECFINLERAVRLNNKFKELAVDEKDFDHIKELNKFKNIIYEI